ncbi:hypothetical protein B9Z55_007819 [Caenorhabditis nigoni]|uniref:MATH domain-containing protein n=1 Tax=Caenorhabditis nigoni TaxID=1611254 RepID=A0A2G5VBE8_9PELO|nr:hypothetical protein B9Z55_007819 [Caenorhabditis nigoni]
MSEKEFTLKYQFKEVGKLEHFQSLSSPKEEHYGVNWKIRIHKWNEIFNMFLHTNLPENREIYIDYNTKIFSKSEEKISIESGSTVLKSPRKPFVVVTTV